MKILDKIDSFLNEGSDKAELKKAEKRFYSFNGNEKKILKRINAMKNLQKIVIFAMVLENENFHNMVEECARRYAEVSGKNMLNDPLWRKGYSAIAS